MTNIWDKPNPNKTHKTLTPQQKSSAKTKAKTAGRSYPNLVDNMFTAKKSKNEEVLDVVKRVLRENWQKKKS